MIRLILGVLWAFFAMLFELPLHFYWKHLAKTNPKKSWIKCRNHVRRFFKGLHFIAGIRLEVRGAENLPDKDHAALYVANHQSWFDIIILQPLIKGPLGFVSKKEFQSFPLLSLYIADMGSIFLDRENIRESLKTIGEGTDRMSMGLSLGLFPEGTRNRSGELLPFKAGGYRMAEKSGNPIIPVAMSNVGRIFEGNKFHFIRSRHVIVEFDKPVFPDQLDKDARKAYYDSIPVRIQEMLDSHKADL